MEELIKAFHQTWDGFPGPARLIGKGNVTIACNKTAEASGLEEGQICAKVGAPESHKGCLRTVALETGKTQMDRPADGKVRVWIPVEGYPDIVVHFALFLPEVNK